MNISRLYSSFGRDFYPSSSVKIFRNGQKPATKKNESRLAKRISPHTVQCTDHTRIDKGSTAAKEGAGTGHRGDEYAENRVKIQMISRNLHEQIFTSKPRKPVTAHDANADKLLRDLKFHQIDPEATERLADVRLQLPALQGANVEEHFYNIAQEQVAPYESLLLPLTDAGGSSLPPRPTHWEYRAGWSVYDPGTGAATAIDHPSDNGLILDIEVCVGEGAAPVIATAVSATHWYSWVSERLMAPSQPRPLSRHQSEMRRRYTPADMIPLGGQGPKLVVGHNVSYDRARIREEYLLADTGTRFIDTMSLHVCVSGITSYQRAMLKSRKQPAAEDADWQAQSALNNLVDVHRLYCGAAGQQLNKEPRNVFVEGSLADVRADFQGLMTYCAGDVTATSEVLRALFPLFRERFPHPATLAGMLELGSAYLPVNSNWERFIKEADLTYEDLDIEAKYHLSRRADEACALLHDERYRQNLWLWDEDWTVQEPKLNKGKKIAAAGTATGKPARGYASEKQHLQDKFQYLYDLRDQLPARRPLLAGYPAWYRKLCLKPARNQDESAENGTWLPGATEIGTGMQIAPKLLSLCWEGYPLHHCREHGWGFLVPFRNEHPAEGEGRIPIEQLVARCPVPEFACDAATRAESEYAMSRLQTELDAKLGKREFYAKKSKKEHTGGAYRGLGVWSGHTLEDCCHFIKLPHKNGSSHRVGNPLSRDFLNKFAENVLTSGDSEDGAAARVIAIARMMSYWRNNRDRITGQLVVWLPRHLQQPAEAGGEVADEGTAAQLDYGAICPMVVACGTLTRRAMEPTWLTASNSKSERIGSELRVMVQAPPGYRIVGADVDSQELWIASVLGDAYACGEHGATALGWMTLSGTKSRGTDMHSITAKAVGISRDHAKVINYARIYGAGQNFAEGLLKQFNPTLSAAEARSKAAKMYAITKGKRVYTIREEFAEQYDYQRRFSVYEALKVAATSQRPVSELFHPPVWQGGTESAMFNRLEEIAIGDAPVTPFLGCRLSRALEAQQGVGHENRFLPTRVNWVVQSGAVDYLHLMLVCMRWLMGSDARFCLSFHDEVRYLIKEELAYKAALAMHVTNLLVRSFCAARIGLHDLPMSVAFFSSVEVDTVLRKESSMDCKTPSNPHGLELGYGIPCGESLDIYQSIEKAGGGDLRGWKQAK